MLLRRFPIAAAAVCCAFLFALLVSAAPQAVDRETYARDYVQFLVLQLDQWSKEFPQQFYLSMMRPPVDATKLSEGAKNGAGGAFDAPVGLPENMEDAFPLGLSERTIR